MKKKGILQLFIFVILIIVCTINLIEVRRGRKIVDISENFNKVDKIIIKSDDNTSNIITPEEVAIFKTYLKPNNGSRFKNINAKKDRVIATIAYYMDTKLLCTQKIHSIKNQNEFTGSDCTFINKVPYLINDDVGYIKFNVSEDSSLEDYLKFD